MTKQASTWRYEYYITDHLGNVRVVFSDIDGDFMPDILQEQAYYPFGMEIEELSMSNLAIPDDYKYNGKELNEEFGLNWYAYGARMYDAAIGRFPSVDPLAEDYADWTPYHYVHGNPIRFTDPTGMKADSAYTYDVNTLEYTPVGDTGGNEFDIITPVVTNEDGSKTAVGDTYVDDFIGFDDPQRGNYFVMASGGLQTMDGGDDPFFTLLTLGLGAGIKGAGAADDVASLGFAANKNSNDATGNFAIYVFKVFKKIFKVGKADADRITKSSGLPTRTHQQLRKLRKKHGKANVDVSVSNLGKTTTKEAKQVETSVLKKIFKRTGKVPEGNKRSFKPKKK